MEKGKQEEQMIIDGVELSNFSDAKKDQNIEIVEENQFETEQGIQLSMDTDVDLEIPKEVVDEKLKQALETQNPKKKKKNTVINLLLLLVNIVFMVFIVKSLISNVGDADFTKIVEQQGSKLWWLLGGVLIYGVYMFAQYSMYNVLIKDITGKKRRKLAYDVAVVGKYYDNVTPFAVGGQPMQIVALSKNGISPGVSTSIPIMKMMLNSIVNVFLVILFFIFGLPRIPHTSAFNDLLLVILEVLGVIGVIITGVVTLCMVLISSGNLVTRSLLSKIIKLGYRLKIVKNYRQTLKKTINQVAEYRSSMKYLWKRKKLLIKMILLCLIECLSYAIMPYFVVRAFSTSIDLSPIMLIFICLVQYYICAMASSFIPLPGGTGLMEISFIFLFGAGVINLGDSIVWALLAWRFLSYYMILIHGFSHELIKIVKTLIKNKRKRET